MTGEQELNIIRRVVGGDPDAFEALVLEYQKPVYNLALRMVRNPEDAEDLAQEAFLRAYRSLSSFREESKFSVWLYRIVSNVCLDRLRAEKKRDEVSSCVEEEDGTRTEMEFSDERSRPDRVLEQTLTRDAVRRGLDALPPDYRQVLLLRELQDLSYEEIGQAMELEPGTVKSRIFRARKKLCEFLCRDGNIPDRYTSKPEKGGSNRERL